MPQIRKEAISQFMRTKCQRQLFLNLYPFTDHFREFREQNNLPNKYQKRPGMNLITEEGDRWQNEKVGDLEESFGNANIFCNKGRNPSGEVKYSPIKLHEILPTCHSGSFIIEGEFDVGSNFIDSMGLSTMVESNEISFSKLRPDIIEILPPHFEISSEDELKIVNPDGSLEWLSPDDDRKKLRIIEIKLTSEPSISYFSEVTYYSLALSGWLRDKHLEEQYIVVSNAAVWPGSHDASDLVKTRARYLQRAVDAPINELYCALQKDIEIVPFAVFSQNLRNFFLYEISRVLSGNWYDLPWHVDNRCKHCDYLGNSWTTNDTDICANHCIPLAEESDHLSRIAFLPRGATNALRDEGIESVEDVASLQPDSIEFNGHYQLRATRTVISGRARSLINTEISIPDRFGTSAIMPKFSHLNIYITVNYDLGSAISLAFGIKAFWIEPLPYGSQGHQTHRYPTREFIVGEKSIESERRELIALLLAIQAIITNAQERSRDTTFQIYIWDSLQYDHFTRIIGRHLPFILENQNIRDLTWLMPPEEIMPNYQIQSQISPLTILKPIVQSLLAIPIPHFYSLFEVARQYHLDSLPPHACEFKVDPFFEDILSDQIPSERAHEIWVKIIKPVHYEQQRDKLKKTIRTQLDAIEAITQRLQHDLKGRLRHNAPRIQVLSSPSYFTNINFDGQLWLHYSKLNAVLDKLEKHQIRALPPHEREARYHSARLIRELAGEERVEFFDKLEITPDPSIRIYKMREESKEVKLKIDDFMFAISPEDQPGILDQKFGYFIRDSRNITPLNQREQFRTLMEDILSITIVAINRDACLIGIRSGYLGRNNVLTELEEDGLIDLSNNLIIDPISKDFFSEKLQNCLENIGNPENAVRNQLVVNALGMINRQGPRRRTPRTPVGDILWSASEISSDHIDGDSVYDELYRLGINLNDSQIIALNESLASRLTLIWGPPGTGKSKTLRAIAIGAIIKAINNSIPFNLLISAQTYNAMENVFCEIAATITRVFSEHDILCARIRASHHSFDGRDECGADIEVPYRRDEPNFIECRNRLLAKVGINIIGSVPGQIYKLLTFESGRAQQTVFDLIILDEASQMDVPLSILVLCSLNENGSVIIAGDPKQLPPIHKAKPPLLLESMVGPVFNYFTEVHNIEPKKLNINYRSNDIIVKFTHHAGYDRDLVSYSPNLSINLISPLPSSKPENWPESLYWTNDLNHFLDPSIVTCCFVYPEGKSGQWNQFEADIVSSLIFLLYQRLSSQLNNEKNPDTGEIFEVSGQAYSSQKFWEKGVGIVTPHRAQQALIITSLQKIFVPLGASREWIRNAVDTVEKFQGLQRDVMIGSFALGDEDAIQQEDEFLLNLNRFNVMVSRARAKMITLASNELVNYLSDDIDVLRNSGLIKTYVDSFCDKSQNMTLKSYKGDSLIDVPGVFKYH